MKGFHRDMLWLYLQWMVRGRNGANGRHVELNALTGEEGSAVLRLLKMVVKTVKGWCYNPRTVQMACACKVSAVIL